MCFTALQVWISMASGYTGVSSLQRNFSSLGLFPLEEVGRDELQWCPVQALGASLWSMLQNTLAHSTRARHKGVLQKAQVELRAITKRTSRLIRGLDPTLAIRNAREAHIQKGNPSPGISVAKGEFTPRCQFWTEVLAGTTIMEAHTCRKDVSKRSWDGNVHHAHLLV